MRTWTRVSACVGPVIGPGSAWLAKLPKERPCLSVPVQTQKKKPQVENARAGMLPGALVTIPMHERLILAKSKSLVHFYLAKSGLFSHQVRGKAWLGRSGHTNAKRWGYSTQNISEHDCDFLAWVYSSDLSGLEVVLRCCLKHLFGRGEIGTPSDESRAKILLELGHHAFEILCVQMHFETYVLACLELREIQLTCLVSWITGRLPWTFDS